jgi:RNA-directed DNA polymerase
MATSTTGTRGLRIRTTSVLFQHFARKEYAVMTIEVLAEAYQDCLRKKRNSPNAIRFEMNSEVLLAELLEDINSRKYSPSQSIAFVVTRPKYREVFAADFRDRIIHHYIAMRITPILESIMNPRSYNCRTGKGTLAGIEQLSEDIKFCSNNYTTDCWVAKVDIKGFFMSISRILLFKKTDELIVKYYKGNDIDDLRFLTEKTILNSPEKNCIKQSPEWMWKYITKDKSLFTNGENMGVPIGNLPSQILANYFIDFLDWMFEKDGIKHHVRYVDDIALVSNNKEKILHSISLARNLLNKCGITLHPKKFYMQYYLKGVQFTGAILKPGRIYITKRVVHDFEESVRNIENAKTVQEITHSVASANSYLGTMNHFKTYAIRRRILQNTKIYDKVYIAGHYEKIVIRKKYNYEGFIRKEIKEKRWHKFRNFSIPMQAST